MVAIVTSNNRLARDNVAPSPSVKADGTNYKWRMFYDSGQTIADSDDTDSLINLLYPEYVGLNKSEDRLAARTQLARSIQASARANVLASLTPDEYENLEEWELAVLSWDGGDPYGWGDGSGELGTVNEEMPDIWNADIPLILLNTSYAPNTEIPAPLSKHGDFYENLPNLFWLRPASELSFLTSLSAIGYIVFGEPDTTPRPRK